MKMNKKNTEFQNSHTPKVFLIMLRNDKVISPNAKVIKTTEGKLTFDVIKKPLHENPVHLMLLWLKNNCFKV